MIELQKGKNTIYVNTGVKHPTYDVILSKLGSKDIKFIGYVIEETDLYVRLQINIVNDLSGEYTYSVISNNKIIDTGLATWVSAVKNTYKEYGKN